MLNSYNLITLWHLLFTHLNLFSRLLFYHMRLQISFLKYYTKKPLVSTSYELFENSLWEQHQHWEWKGLMCTAGMYYLKLTRGPGMPCDPGGPLIPCGPLGPWYKETIETKSQFNVNSLSKTNQIAAMIRIPVPVSQALFYRWKFWLFHCKDLLVWSSWDGHCLPAWFRDSLRCLRYQRSHKQPTIK